MPQDEVLICRSCKIAAQAELVDGQIVSIACPSCGVLVEGDAAGEVYLQQARYRSIKMAQDVFSKGFSKDRSIEYQPGRVKDPGGPFTIGKPDS